MYRKPTSVDELTKNNIDTVVALEEKTKSKRSRTEKVIDKITCFCGTVYFVWVNIIWFTGWIIINSLLLKNPFDPYPFTFLTFCVSLEAIFLSLFILITQNRELEVDENRSQLDLQVNLLSEQENTKMLSMLKDICDKLDIDTKQDPAVEVLSESAEPENLAHQIDSAKQK